MTRTIIFTMVVLVAACTTTRKQQQSEIAGEEVERILKTLSSDEMKGRASFTEGVEKAANFIEAEFRSYGLQPLNGGSSYRLPFSVTRVSPSLSQVQINGRIISNDSVFTQSDLPSVEWTSQAEVIYIRSGENLFGRYREIMDQNIHSLVMIDPSFASQFRELGNYLSRGRVIDTPNEKLAAVFVLGNYDVTDHAVKIENKVETLPLFNVAGLIPGKSRKADTVIFSAHYDHIGVLPAVNGDSIANGADDDASGVTAVLSLAKHFKQLNNNERTLLFVAFTAEELGLIGSRYFSKNINADSVVAMFNIEMIGKLSRFGKNAAFITGFERSDFGTILQKNLQGTSFIFHPDPYTAQNLFYRSDNASLAEKGVPAHTISTDQIDIDKYYHTVDDEFETIDVENVKSTIRAIALSARGIVSGTDTPKRVSVQK
jgi:hypothetical protein